MSQYSQNENALKLTASKAMNLKMNDIIILDPLPDRSLTETGVLTSIHSSLRKRHSDTISTRSEVELLEYNSPDPEPQTATLNTTYSVRCVVGRDHVYETSTEAYDTLKSLLSLNINQGVFTTTLRTSAEHFGSTTLQNASTGPFTVETNYFEELKTRRPTAAPTPHPFVFNPFWYIFSVVIVMLLLLLLAIRQSLVMKRKNSIGLALSKDASKDEKEEESYGSINSN